MPNLPSSYADKLHDLGTLETLEHRKWSSKSSRISLTTSHLVLGLSHWTVSLLEAGMNQSLSECENVQWQTSQGRLRFWTCACDTMKTCWASPIVWKGSRTASHRGWEHQGLFEEPPSGRQQRGPTLEKVILFDTQGKFPFGQAYVRISYVHSWSWLSDQK